VNQLLLKRNLLVLAVLLVSVVLVLYFEPGSQLDPGTDPLTDIRSIETLRTQFNHDGGKTRLIMLLSPT
jgi:hypothetical protein